MAANPKQTENKKLIVLIVLSILAVFSLIYGIATPPKGKRRSSGTGNDVYASILLETVRTNTRYTESHAVKPVADQILEYLRSKVVDFIRISREYVQKFRCNIKNIDSSLDQCDSFP